MYSLRCLREGLNYIEHCLGKLYEKGEAWAVPWKTYHADKISLLRANEPAITVVIRFPCVSQIRCVNIIKNISLCSADLQQIPPGIVVLRKDDKLALISFPTHQGTFLLLLLCKQERDGLCWASPKENGLQGDGGSGFGTWLSVLYHLVLLCTSFLYSLAFGFSFL